MHRGLRGARIESVLQVDVLTCVRTWVKNLGARGNFVRVAKPRIVHAFELRWSLKCRENAASGRAEFGEFSSIDARFGAVLAPNCFA